MEATLSGSDGGCDSVLDGLFACRVRLAGVEALQTMGPSRARPYAGITAVTRRLLGVLTGSSCLRIGDGDEGASYVGRRVLVLVRP